MASSSPVRAHASPANLINASLCVAALALWRASVDVFVAACTGGRPALSASPACREPVLGISLLLLCAVSVPFWIAGLIQGSFWLIDPFWTLIPLMVAYAYSRHPSRPPSDPAHFLALLGLLTTWSARLTHSYFRREGYRFGVRQDWRYTLVARRCGRRWWWASFWAVCFLQQVMLTGLTIPVYSVLFSPREDWAILDSASIVFCSIGVVVAFRADNDLHRFVSERRGGILRSGLWRWSRHPNYFGEQLFWWSLSLMSISRGDGWAIVGPLFNTIVFVPTTLMTEERMLRDWPKPRADLYREYQRTTSAWIPWFPGREGERRDA